MMETTTTTTNLGYNKRTSSSSSSPTTQQSQQSQQAHTLIFNNEPQNLTDPDLTVSTTKTIYRECLRNHAASMGSHVVDGCGEFMPSGENGTPQSLKCAACDCHRNFHRKHVQQQQQQNQEHVSYDVPNFNGHIQFPTPSTSRQVPPLMMMSFGSGQSESSSEDLNVFQCDAGAQFSIETQQQQVCKKRNRTKFTQEQKEKMMEFGEKVGWKIQKHDEERVQQFCSQIGIKRQVFKVWMHNNKQIIKKITPNVSLIN